MPSSPTILLSPDGRTFFLGVLLQARMTEAVTVIEGVKFEREGEGRDGSGKR